jgi:hypothetical protein
MLVRTSPLPLRYQFLKAIKLAKEHPDATFKHGLTGWWPDKGREMIAQFW